MDLSVYFQNTRGLRSKLVDFRVCTEASNYDIICINESWLHSGIYDTELFDLDKYNLFRRDRETSASTKQDGGGVLIATRTELGATIIPEFSSEAEDIWVHINLGYKNLYVCCVYLPPGDKYVCLCFTSKLEWVSSHLGDNIILVCGDMNCSTVNWEQTKNYLFLSPSNVPNEYSDLIDTLSFSGLMQFNHLKNNINRTLDLILCNDDKINSLMHCSTPIVSEDLAHPAIEFVFSNSHVRKLKDLNKQYVNFNRADYFMIKSDLKNTPWAILFKNKSLDDNLKKTFYQILNNIILERVPTSFKCGTFPSYYSSATIKVIKEKNKFHKKWKIYRNLSDLNTFKLLRSRSKRLISTDLANYVNYIETEIPNNSKKFWQFLSVNRKNAGIPSKIEYNNLKSSDHLEICNMFAEYFESMFVEARDVVLPNDSHHANSNNLSCIELSQDEVLTVLKSVDPKKGAGCDGIPSSFVKTCATELSTPLVLLFNQSLSSGYFPDMWKLSHIIPIFKNGNKNLVINYRPISKLCVFAKLFEKLIYNYIYNLVKRQIIFEQHGFLANRSLESNLLEYLEFLKSNLDNRVQVDAIYTDFSKAFDKINHSIMLNKLKRVGVDGMLLKWIDSYLYNRKFSVFINGVSSNTIPITSGVPQGSHLGPLFFVIYLNDIANCFKYSKFILYADDLKIFRQIKSSEDCDLIQDDLHRFQNYCRDNSLFINVEKCCVITFTRNRQTFVYNYALNAKTLKKVSEVKDLGVIFDEKLIFDKHIEKMVSSCFKMLGFINRQSKIFKRAKSYLSLYYSFVNSRMNFASVIWNPCYEIYKRKIERIQNKFLHSLLYRHGDELGFNSIDQLRTHFNILTLENRRTLSDILFLHKIVTDKIDSPNLLSKISFNVAPRILRYNYLFNIQFAHTTSSQNAPISRMMKVTNLYCLDLNIDLFTSSLTSIKSKVRNALML